MKLTSSFSLEISSLTISLFVHATEDSIRLTEAIKTIFGLDDRDLKIQQLTGYHGNEILSVSAHLVGKAAMNVFKNLLNQIDQGDKVRLTSELEKHMDEHDALFLRIEKDSMVQRNSSKLRLGEEESVRIKAKPKNRFGGHGPMVEEYRRMISESDEI
jgi:RNA binding exosome subunit